MRLRWLYAWTGLTLGLVMGQVVFGLVVAFGREFESPGQMFPGIQSAIWAAVSFLAIVALSPLLGLLWGRAMEDRREEDRLHRSRARRLLRVSAVLLLMSPAAWTYASWRARVHQRQADAESGGDGSIAVYGIMVTPRPRGEGLAFDFKMSGSLPGPYRLHWEIRDPGLNLTLLTRDRDLRLDEVGFLVRRAAIDYAELARACAATGRYEVGAVEKDLEVTATLAYALPPAEVERLRPFQRDIVRAAKTSRASARFLAAFTMRAEDFAAAPGSPP